MAIEQQDIYYAYTGNGAVATFAYGCRIFKASDLVVKVNGVIQGYGIHYTLSGVDSVNGGEVTFLPGYFPSGLVELERVLTYARATGYIENGDFRQETVDRDQDYQTALLQQMEGHRRYYMRLPVGSNAEMQLPTATPGGILAWNQAGTGIEYLLTGPPYISTTVSASAYGTDLSAALNAIGAARVRLIVDSPVTVNSNLTVPDTIQMRVDVPGVFTIAAGRTLTISGPFSAGSYQIFMGGGTVMGLKEARPEWFGSKPDGVTDSRASFQSAIDCVASSGAGSVLLSEGVYLMGSVVENWHTIKSKSGVSLAGVGPASVIKIKDGLRNSSMGTCVYYTNEAISNLTISDLTIDYNGQNNLFLSGYDANYSGVNRTGGNGGGSNVKVRNVVFKNSAGFHFLWFAGGFTNLDVSNNSFFESGSSLAGNTISDFSGIYADGENHIISNNLFINSSQDEIGTAIEIHGKNTVASGNIIKKYSQGFNVAADTGDISNVCVCSNVIESAYEGIRFWSASNYHLDYVSISSNVMRLLEKNGTVGIRSSASAGMASSVNGNHLNIENNNIMFLTSVNLTWALIGMHIQNFDNVLIQGNKISNCIMEAIYVQAVSGRPMTGITIQSNIISDCGITSTASNKRAIAINGDGVTAASLDRVLIQGNNINLGAASGTVASYGIQFNLGPNLNSRVINNTILGAAIAPVYRQTINSGELFYIEGEGPYRPATLMPATLGSKWYDTQGKRQYSAIDAANDRTSSVWRSIEYGTAAPTTGAHLPGDRWYHHSGAGGGVCTGSGTPGTWSSGL